MRAEPKDPWHPPSGRKGATMKTLVWATIGLIGVSWAGMTFGTTDADRCETAKLKRAGQYSFCRLKAEAKAVRTGDPVDYSKCDLKFSAKWADAESGGGGACPTTGDAADIQDQVTRDADWVALKLTGARFVDNGDGTVTDTQTGLQWEKKGNLDDVANFADPHDADNTYTWNTTSGGETPDGTAFTDFLYKLNNCTFDGSTYAGGFAGHCDWRVPALQELETIIDLTAPGCGSGSPCIPSIFSPTPTGFYNHYWSISTDAGTPYRADVVVFYDGQRGFSSKANSAYVRAVRGGL